MPPRVFHPIAFCPEHGIFPMTMLALQPGATGNFQNSQTNCPKCGRMSEIIPGRYEAKADRLNLLIDASISPQSLAALRDLAEAAQRGVISAAEAKKAAEKIHPKAGRLFDVAQWSDQAKATLYGAIIASATAIAVARMATAPSQTVIMQPVIERVVSKQDLLSSSSLSGTGQTAKAPLPKPRPKKRH